MNSNLKHVTGHEKVLFRTHSEILTDQRLIIRGNSFPLRAIAKVEVKRAGYYVPFLLGRLVLVPLVVLLLLSFFGVVARDVVPGNPNINMLAGMLLGLAVIFLTWIVPTHTLNMQASTGEKAMIMRGHDAGYLREVKVKIENATRAQQESAL